MTDQPDFQRGQDFPGTSGLLPAIAQDFESGRVLMMAWMDESAWRETIETQRAVYFSRSRGKLWRKGETSGHQQIVKEARIDCDADTILLLVEQPALRATRATRAVSFERSIPTIKLISPMNDLSTLTPFTDDQISSGHAKRLLTKEKTT